MGIVVTLEVDFADVNLDLQRYGAAGGPGTGRTLTLVRGWAEKCAAVLDLCDDRSLLITISPCDRSCREAP